MLAMALLLEDGGQLVRLDAHCVEAAEAGTDHRDDHDLPLATQGGRPGGHNDGVRTVS